MVYSDNYVTSLQIGDVIDAGNNGEVTVEVLERSDDDWSSYIRISSDGSYHFHRTNGDTGWALACYEHNCQYVEKTVTVVIAADATTEDWLTPLMNGTGSEPIQSSTGAKTVEEFYQKYRIQAHHTFYTVDITIKNGMVTDVVFYYVPMI